MTLDEYIEKLLEIRATRGGDLRVITSGGDYPDDAYGPRYITARQASGYTPLGSVVLD